jgi:mannose/fructose-specific phosphotransferase system component IIA
MMKTQKIFEYIGFFVGEDIHSFKMRIMNHLQDVYTGINIFLTDLFSIFSIDTTVILFLQKDGILITDVDPPMLIEAFTLSD